MHIGIGIVLMLIAAAVSLFFAVGRLKENGAALEHATRELLLRLEAIEERLAQMERSSLESMSLIRETVSASARSDREELARNFAAFSESQSRYIKDFTEIHRSAIDALSDRLEKLAGCDGVRLGTPGARQSVERSSQGGRK
ncbi:MAG: hypothetical protein LBO21_08335 [Synergistaceae bacterium]|jgi:DNA recombination protein RmuC|nr:hypothetical protein [Synergistaceae bacterium]